MKDFETFFQTAFGRAHDPDFKPFHFQLHLAQNSWPDLLDVPTGLGKTAAVVLAWLWKRGWRQGRREEESHSDEPRRLVYCLPMRVLVEQVHGSVRGWLGNLGIAGSAGEGKVSLHLLMGGSEDARGAFWAEHPEEDMILIGTQDMLLSAALNRAYAAYPSMWPVHFGLLNVDAFWVMDEIQLMGPGRTTSVQLDHYFRTTGAANWSLRRTLWMSATTGAAGGGNPAWFLTPEIREASRTLSPYEPAPHELDPIRLNAPKQLRVEKNYTYESDALQDQIVQAAGAGSGQLVLVFVNTVKRARSLFEALQRKCDGRKIKVMLIHSRYRQRDRAGIVQQLLGPCSQSRIVVSTQVLEAGVDLDANALFTEIAPWPSLVQRFGRLNRLGRKQSAEAAVFELPNDSQDIRRFAPYEASEIEEAWEKLRQVPQGQGGLSPKSLRSLPATVKLEGPVLRRFTLEEELFPTDADLSGGYTDVAPYLRAADREVDCYVLWRELPSEQNPNAFPPEEQPSVHRDELCPAPFYEARDAFEGKHVWILAYSLEARRTAVWRDSSPRQIRAGDTVMVPLEYGGYDENRGWLGKDDLKSRPRSWMGKGAPNLQWARVWRTIQGESVVDHDADPETGLGGDPRSFWKRRQRAWMTLTHHLQLAQKAADHLVKGLGFPSLPSREVVEAALWHDWGKALERPNEDGGGWRRPFQEMLRREGEPDGRDPATDELYAKSKPRTPSSTAMKDPTADSDRFRHEVASTLAYLQPASVKSSNPCETSLVAYLIMAHHGKVRVMPQPWDDQRMDDWNGVRPTDRIAVVCAGSSSQALGGEEFLPSPNHPGWQGRVAQLLEKYGPFRLAYLEALVRIADWRAS